MTRAAINHSLSHALIYGPYCTCTCNSQPTLPQPPPPAHQLNTNFPGGCTALPEPRKLRPFRASDTPKKAISKQWAPCLIIKAAIKLQHGGEWESVATLVDPNPAPCPLSKWMRPTAPLTYNHDRDPHSHIFSFVPPKLVRVG